MRPVSDFTQDNEWTYLRCLKKDLWAKDSVSLNWPLLWRAHTCETQAQEAAAWAAPETTLRNQRHTTVKSNKGYMTSIKYRFTCRIKTKWFHKRFSIAQSVYMLWHCKCSAANTQNRGREIGGIWETQNLAGCVKSVYLEVKRQYFKSIIQVKEVKDKGWLISNFIISHSKKTKHGVGGRGNTRAKLCYIKITIETKISDFPKKKKKRGRKKKDSIKL